MALYRIGPKRLEEIKQQDFKLEKDLQQLVEQNMTELFGLQFIATEVELNSLRIDSLAYDQERNSFVVIEYKRDKSSSVVDQGYAYLALVLNNKAHFVLEYQRKIGKQSDIDSFDWGQIRVMFIANRFTPYQLGAISFKDLPIELWEAKLYQNDLLFVEQRQADKTLESIKTISQSNRKTVQDKVRAEIKTYTPDDLIKPEWKNTRELYEYLRFEIQALDPNIVESAVRAHATYRLGSDWRNVINLKFSQQGIVVEFTRTQPQDLTDPEGRVQYIEYSIKWYNQHISCLAIHNEKDADYAIPLIRQAYRRHVERFGKE